MEEVQVILERADRLSVDELVTVRNELDKLIVAAYEREKERLLELEGRIPSDILNRVQGASKPSSASGRKPARPKFRSKRDASLTWTGKGKMPKWMEAEMQAHGISNRDEFLIPEGER